MPLDPGRRPGRGARSDMVLAAGTAACAGDGSGSESGVRSVVRVGCRSRSKQSATRRRGRGSGVRCRRAGWLPVAVKAISDRTARMRSGVRCRLEGWLSVAVKAISDCEVARFGCVAVIEAGFGTRADRCHRPNSPSPARRRSDRVVGDEGVAGRRDRPGHDRAREHGRARARAHVHGRGPHAPGRLLPAALLASLAGPADLASAWFRPFSFHLAARRSCRGRALLPAVPEAVVRPPGGLPGGCRWRVRLPRIACRSSGSVLQSRGLAGAALPGRGGARHGRAGAARAESCNARSGFAPHAGGSCSNRRCPRVGRCLLVGVIPTRIVHPVTAHRGRGQLRAMARG